MHTSLVSRSSSHFTLIVTSVFSLGSLSALGLAPLSARACDCQAKAQEKSSDKSRYTLFNPTPRDQMREFATDRPDKTESPYSVDAGHFQFETDLVTLTRDSGVTSAIFNNINLKAGITNNSDFQVVFGSFAKTWGVGGATGVTDLTLRYKQNLWGNDGGRSAFAIMPYVTFATQSASLGPSSSQAGIVMPFAYDLVEGIGLGAQLQMDWAKDGAGSGYHPEFLQSVTLWYELTSELGMYTEFFSAASTETGASWVATGDVGFTYALNENTQLDLGVNIGLTEAADDLNPFTGLSMRF